MPTGTSQYRRRTYTGERRLNTSCSTLITPKRESTWPAMHPRSFPISTSPTRELKISCCCQSLETGWLRQCHQNHTATTATLSSCSRVNPSWRFGKLTKFRFPIWHYVTCLFYPPFHDTISITVEIHLYLHPVALVSNYRWLSCWRSLYEFESELVVTPQDLAYYRIIWFTFHFRFCHSIRITWWHHIQSHQDQIFLFSDNPVCVIPTFGNLSGVKLTLLLY